jgi:thiamine-monophosphate kinase
VAGVHAYPDEPPEAVGARALTAAVSDVVAMGGEPLLALVALQAPSAGAESELLALYDGIGAEASHLGVAVVGWYVVDTPGPMALAVAVFGTADPDKLWLRSAARPGDLLAVTGELGGSRAGLELLGDRSQHDGAEAWMGTLIDRHLRPHARIDAMRRLKSGPGVHAAIDVSDGLSSEAWHLAIASGVTVRIEAAAIPIHPALAPYLTWLEGNAQDRSPPDRLDYALNSGEEYELLLAIDPGHPLVSGSTASAGASVVSEPGSEALTVIGRIETGDPAVHLVGEDGSTPIEAGGYSHRRTDGGSA